MQKLIFEMQILFHQLGPLGLFLDFVVDTMYIIVQSLSVFLTAVTPTAVAPIAVRTPSSGLGEQVTLSPCHALLILVLFPPSPA